MNSPSFPSTCAVEMVFGIVGDCQTSHHTLSLSIHRFLQCDYEMKMMGKFREEISNNPLKIQSLQTKQKNTISHQRTGSNTQVMLRTFRLRSFTANWVLSQRKVDHVIWGKSPLIRKTMEKGSLKQLQTMKTGLKRKAYHHPTFTVKK